MVPSEQAADNGEDHNAEQRDDRAVKIVSMMGLPDLVERSLTRSMH